MTRHAFKCVHVIRFLWIASFIKTIEKQGQHCELPRHALPDRSTGGL